MELLREYILSIASASVISGILTTLLDKKGSAGTMGKMFCGVFLAITLIRPLGDISFDSITDWLNTYSVEGGVLVNEGEEITSASTQSIIKTNCEAYILDKGADMGLKLTAQVKLDPKSPYAPVSVMIFGDIPPYKKATLEDILIQDLAIAKEQIQWQKRFRMF